MPARLLLASNRGPVSFAEEPDGSLRQHRGGGGLISALAGAPEDALWVCAALTDADRRAAREGVVVDGPVPTRVLDIDPVVLDRAYNGVANATLWFAHHLLWDVPSTPTFGPATRTEWAAFTSYSSSFAEALAAEAATGATVLVQDYHLSLVPRLLRALRPDLRIGHFSHTPWAPAEYLRLLPDTQSRDLLTGLLGADSVGFHSRRWAAAFGRSCQELLGLEYDGDAVHHDRGTTRVRVHPLGVAAGELRERAGRPDVALRSAALRQAVGDRQVVVRIDRTELSKNIVRGLEAYRELLVRWPEHRGRVVHLAFAYPSRHDLPEYREYTGAVQRLARDINTELGDSSWQPVHLEVRDDYPRSLAAYALADVLLVNPVRDGMNLVAKEGPLLSERGVSLVLSREAGAADELGEDALLVNPFDVSETAEALHCALVTDPAERKARSDRLAAAACALPPDAWLRQQLNALLEP